MCVAHVGLLAAKKRGSQLHRAGTKHEGRGCRATVGDAAGCDYRNAHGVNDLRQKRKQAWLLADVDAGEGRAMSPSLHSLRDHSIHTPFLEQSGLGNRSGARHHKDAGRFDGLYDLRRWQAEVEAHDLRFRVEKHREVFRANVAAHALRFWDGAETVGVETAL